MTRTVIESKSKTTVIGFDEPFCVIGERINPTGRKKLAAELEAGDFSTVERDALEQAACGAMVLDVNAGVVYNSSLCRGWWTFPFASTVPCPPRLKPGSRRPRGARSSIPSPARRSGSSRCCRW